MLSNDTVACWGNKLPSQALDQNPIVLAVHIAIGIRTSITGLCPF